MSNGAFAIALVLGAALLALWADVRFPREGLKMQSVVGHSIAALAVLYVIPGSVGSPVAAMVTVFALVLPALVYLCLSAVWFVRLTQASLGSSAR